MNVTPVTEAEWAAAASALNEQIDRHRARQQRIKAELQWLEDEILHLDKRSRAMARAGEHSRGRNPEGLSAAQ